MQRLPRYSFVIPAHNEEALVGRCVSSINGAVTKLGLGAEVIVVDDASTDRTGEIAREHGATVLRVEHRQISQTRNAGARAAKGCVVVFVDGDTAVTTGALRGVADAIESGASGGGGTINFDGEVPRLWRVLLPVMQTMLHALKLSGGCFMFCMRDAFESSGGFDETVFASEEIAFARAIRRHGRFVIVREPVITSGRKTRTLRKRDIAGFFLRAILSGGRILRRRDRLPLWYAERPRDPFLDSSDDATSR